MKKFFTLVVLALLAVGCTMEYDDTGIRDLINGLDVRISKLENDISALQSAVGDGKFVRKVEEYKDPETGRTTGITVTYTDGNVVHFNIVPTDPSEGPVFSVIRNGAGELVWAVDGIAIKVDGEEVPVYETPVFSIDEEGNLWVEVAGKKTNLGPVATGGATLQDGIFTDLAVTDDAVVLTLSDGTTVNIPFAEAFKLNIDTTEYEYETMDPIIIPYTVSAKTSGTVVAVSGYNPKAFKVEVDDANIVITPLKLTESAVLLAYADSKVGLTSFVNIVINSAIEEGPKNLGKKGTANCYLVTEAGEYKFPLVKGNTEESVGAVAKAALLWETWNNQDAVTPNSVIASVDYSGDFITFATPATLKPGNALIAALDANDEVLWSWHIWIPATPITDAVEQNYSVKAAMSRNLGALVDTPAILDPVATVESFGLLYEWGRKDPFPGLGVVSGTGAITVAGTEMTSQVAPMTVEEAIKNPTVYVIKNETSKDWLPEITDEVGKLWGETEKSVYDPCPVGYMLPQRNTSCGFWDSGTNLNDREYFALDADNCCYTVGSMIFPLAGYIAEDGEGQKKAGARTIVWSARWDSGTENGYGMYGYIDDGIKFKRAGQVRTRGGSVRCVAESAE
ncbi:MAG: hypothetical protein IKW27_01405 [Bacteroidales bacterium]|nr:hypothetical protein [Bacteroidales bacterium]